MNKTFDSIRRLSPISYTTFESLRAKPSGTSFVTSGWGDFCGMLRGVPEAAKKADLPLLSFCRYGAELSKRGSVRHSANVVEVTGIEGDYDDGEVSLDEAYDRLMRCGIGAVVYTSPSHTVLQPRWRVIAPLSKPVAPEERRRLVGILNAALGGILAKESFQLSQSFYYGRVSGCDYEVRHRDGIGLDQIEGIDPVFPSEGAIKTHQVEPVAFTEDNHTDVLRAIHLLRRAPSAKSGEGGNNQTYVISCQLRDLGLSQQLARELMHSHYNPRCEPPWAVGDLNKIVDSAYRNARNAHGVESVTARLEENDELQFSEIGIPELRDRKLTSVPYVVEGILPKHVGVLNAQGGTGKSTLVLYLLVCIVLGRKVFQSEQTDSGFRVLRPGQCIFVTKEDGASEAWFRIQEICHSMSLASTEIEKVVRNINVLDLEDSSETLIELDFDRRIKESSLVQRLVDLVNDRCGEDGEPVQLVVFDPRSMFGADENALNVNEMLLASVARKISRALDCAVIYIGHVAKHVARQGIDDQYAGRGGTAQADNSRFVWNLVQEKAEDKRKVIHTVPHAFRQFVAHGWVNRLSFPKMSYGARPSPLFVCRNLVQSPFLFEFAEELAPNDEEQRKNAEQEDFERMRMVSSEILRLEEMGSEFSRSELRSMLARALDMSQNATSLAITQAVNAGYLRIKEESRYKKCVVTDDGRAWLTEGD